MQNSLPSPAPAILVCALVTILLRFLPFLLFRRKRETPAILVWLGQVLPFAVMAMLVVFCFRKTDLLHSPWGLPELIAGAAVVALHAWKKNTLLSIGCGTVCYMILIQCVF